MVIILNRKVRKGLRKAHKVKILFFSSLRSLRKILAFFAVNGFWLFIGRLRKAESIIKFLKFGNFSE
jgi:hypothetical protein